MIKLYELHESNTQLYIYNRTSYKFDFDKRREHCIKEITGREIQNIIVDSQTEFCNELTIILK